MISFRIILCASLLIVSSETSTRVNSQDKVPGISAEKPKDVRSVYYEGKYLVPYSFLIPGTDVSVDMVPVPPGKFRLFLDNESGKSAVKKKQSIIVHVAPFWIAKTETTWRQYRPFMELDGVFRKLEHLKIRRINESNKADAVAAPSEIYEPNWRIKEYGGSASHPAATMTQFGAKCYTKYLTKLTGNTYRLPSAVEWQYAAIGKTDSMLIQPIKVQQLVDLAWLEVNSLERKKVATKKPNAWGIHDMLGNVSEWVLDGNRFDPQLRNSMQLSSLDAVAWPTGQRNRLAIGGSFLDPADKCQFDSKLFSSDDLWEYEANIPLSPHWTASDKGQGIGFRIVRPLNDKVPPQLAKRYWEPADDVTAEEVKEKIDGGRMAIGIVDSKLPMAIQKFVKAKK